MESIREIQSTQLVTAWVDSNLESCLPLPANVQSFCNINYNTPAYFATKISGPFRILQGNLQLVETVLGQACANTVKNIICDGTFPQCSADSSTATFGDFNSSCTALASCNTNGTSFSNLTQFCQESGKSFDLNSCTAYAGTTFSAQHCGDLPQNISFPSWLASNLGSQAVVLRTIQTSFSTFGITQSCQAKWINMICVLVPFCNSDETELLTAVTRSICEDAINW